MISLRICNLLATKERIERKVYSMSSLRSFAANLPSAPLPCILCIPWLTFPEEQS
jgi:hypothetical protein